MVSDAAARRLTEENDRVTRYLDPFTRRSLIAVVEQELIKRHVQTAVEKGFATLLDDDRDVDLSRMYKLLARVNELVSLRNACAAHIKKVGVDMVAKKERDPSVVADLLQLQAKVDRILEGAFQSDDQFSGALRAAVAGVVNHDENRMAELIGAREHTRMRNARIRALSC